jgi:nicotinamide-nucleotide amidase
VRVEVVAIGTELLLGQIVDTNSSHIGEQLAASGIDCHFQTKVGDNLERIVLALRTALARSDGVIACGGLGPTQDDITREAIAAVMNVGLHRDEGVLETIRALFDRRGRAMSENNARQAEVPDGATVIPQRLGTAPGLICPVGRKVVYAVPGVPFELAEMLERAVLPDLRARGGEPAVIASRTLRTWGLAESHLAEVLGPYMDSLDVLAGSGDPAVPTLAFLASGIEGIKVRMTVKAPDAEAAGAALSATEATVRDLLGHAVFGVDDETMEAAVGRLLTGAGWTLAVAESLTGGLVASRIVSVPGASDWFVGGLVAYASDVKRQVLGIGDGPVVSAAAATEMAVRAREVLGADAGLSTTGVAGPAEQEGQAVGTVFCGLALPGRDPDAVELHLPGDRERIRQYATISVLDALRRRLTPAGYSSLRT